MKRVKHLSQHSGVVLIYTLLFITIMGLVLSQLSRNIKLEQQLNFALNQRTELSLSLDNYSRQLPFIVNKNIHWQQLSNIQLISSLSNTKGEIHLKEALSCNSSPYNLFDVVEKQTQIKAPVAATFLSNRNKETPSYLVATLLCVSNSHVQFWLTELVLLQYFQDGTVSKLYTAQFQQLKGL